MGITYIATPYSHHYQNVKLCLQASKNMLYKTAFTVNAVQAEKLIQIIMQKTCSS